MRGMSEPGEEDLQKLKRVLRFLKGEPRKAIQIPWYEFESGLKVHVDADFAGCVRTRRSTSGGALMWKGVRQRVEVQWRRQDRVLKVIVAALPPAAAPPGDHAVGRAR